MATHEIEVGDRFFRPNEVFVRPGDIITFRLTSGWHSVVTTELGEKMTVTPQDPPTPDQSEPEDIVIPAWNGSAERSVVIGGTEGTWVFVCGLHPGQHRGQVSIATVISEPPPV